ncbi:MAG TPA: hypothetical protein VH186_24685 [Chloroflexia bacterium]|nr:hypothetical protein [Chloroflexia bacterium]
MTLYSDSATSSPGSILRQQSGSGVKATTMQPGENQYLPSLVQNISITIERQLPALGEVLVAPGQRVDSDTIVARTLLPGRPRVYNLADYFELPASDISKLVEKKVGAKLSKGEVIASTKSLIFSRQFKAPYDAILSAVDANSGYISLTPQPQPYNLEAFVRGNIASTMPGYGVNVELQANYARGAFGFGGERHGVLRVLATRPTDPIDPLSVDSRTTNFILLGGSYITAETLRRAVEMKVRGIITGSIREEEITKFLEYRNRKTFYQVGQHGWRFPADLSGQDSPLTLIITEGFGMRPMASRLFEMLLAHDSEELSINGVTRLRRGWQRPEIIVPVLTSLEANRASTRLGAAEQLPRPGATVRLINPTYLGAVGTVISLPPSRRNSAHGHLDRLAEVEVSGTRLVLPFADLEVLEQRY